MNLRMLSFVLAASAALAGCAHEPDVEIQNPLASHAVQQNQITKPHAYAEQTRGLPPGSMTDQASLLSLDPAQICFGVSLHELDPIDLRTVEARMISPKLDPIDQAEVAADPPSYQTYDGLVPERRETGSETVCSSRDSDGVCQSWQTRPTYSTVYVRGPVNVYQTRGRVCFQNHGFATSATEQIGLELRLRRQGATFATVGMWGGGATKKVLFVWGFGGGGKS